LLGLIVLSLPFFGWIADKINNKNILIVSMSLSISLLIPLSYFVVHSRLYGLIATMVVFSLLISCNTALLSYNTPVLFPTRVRYTCLALSFNISDTFVGGFMPFLILEITRLTNYAGAFSWVLLIFAVISLISYVFMKEKNLN